MLLAYLVIFPVMRNKFFHTDDYVASDKNYRQTKSADWSAHRLLGIDLELSPNRMCVVFSIVQFEESSMFEGCINLSKVHQVTITPH